MLGTELPPPAAAALAGLGALVAASASYNGLVSLWQHFLRPSRIHRYLRRAPDGSQTAWAVVTGASDGIGKGFVEELCAEGFNVVLHGRNRAKLERLQAALAQQFPRVRTRLAVLDAAGWTDESLQALVDGLADLEVTVLVNNVGGGGQGGPGALEPALRPHERFSGAELDFLESINLRFPSHLTAALLPAIKSTGRPAAVISVSSGSAVFPCPYLAGYAGAKAFNLAWSRSMAAEQRCLGRSDVEFLALVVGMVRNQSDVVGDNFFRVEARDYARASLRYVGWGHTYAYPHWRHAAQIAGLNALPEWMSTAMLVNITKGLVANEQKSK